MMMFCKLIVSPSNVECNKLDSYKHDFSMDFSICILFPEHTGSVLDGSTISRIVPETLQILIILVEEMKN
jgi:hypothetical protein